MTITLTPLTMSNLNNTPEKDIWPILNQYGIYRGDTITENTSISIALMLSKLIEPQPSTPDKQGESIEERATAYAKKCYENDPDNFYSNFLEYELTIAPHYIAAATDTEAIMKKTWVEISEVEKMLDRLKVPVIENGSDLTQNETIEIAKSNLRNLTK